MPDYFRQSHKTLEDSLLELIANELDPSRNVHSEYPARRRKLHKKQEEIRNSNAKRKVIRAGRRGGKTVTASDIAIEEFQKGRRILYATPTAEQIDRFWFEVNVALQDGIDAGIYRKNETRHIIEVRATENRIRAKTAWNAETLRGDYADVLILDEFQLMTENTWNEVGAPMLLDNDGDAIFIYTPPSLRMRAKSRATDPQNAAKMFKKAKADTTGRWAAFHFSSHDNPYISKEALEEITTDITDLSYRQEILAEDVDEAPGALWTRALLTQTRLDKVQFLARIVVAIDPSGSSSGNEAGIIGAGMKMLGERQHFYVLKDDSLQGSPEEWARRAIDLFYELDADHIVAEMNYGGEMVRTVINQIDDAVPVVLVQATRGKEVRAEPVSVLFTEGRGHMVGTYYALEDECCLWIPGDPSPNRLDAMVWAATDLMLQYTQAGAFGRRRKR